MIGRVELGGKPKLNAGGKKAESGGLECTHTVPAKDKCSCTSHVEELWTRDEVAIKDKQRFCFFFF